MARRSVDHPRIGNLRTPVLVIKPNTASNDGIGGITPNPGTQVADTFCEIRSPTGREVFMAGRNESIVTHVITFRDFDGFDIRPGYDIIMKEFTDRIYRVQTIRRTQERGVWVIINAEEKSGDSGSGC